MSEDLAEDSLARVSAELRRMVDAGETVRLTPTLVRMTPPASPREVVACAAWLFGTTPRDILQPSKHQAHVDARWAVMKALSFRGSSRSSIGRLLGKDHSTVIHGIRRAEQVMAVDYAFADKVATLVALRDGEFLSQKRMAACKQKIPMLRSTAPTTQDHSE